MHDNECEEKTTNIRLSSLSRLSKYCGESDPGRFHRGPYCSQMPEEGPSRPKPNRWEGTQTYKKPEAEKKRARTVAQLREEATARSKASREKAIKNRRGSIGESPDQGPSTARRRGSIGGLPATAGIPTSRELEGGETEVEEEFFDADEMPGSGKKKKGPAASPTGANGNEEDLTMEVDKPCGIDPAMKAFLISMKTDINASTNAAVERIEKRIRDNEKAVEKLGEETSKEIRKLREHVDETKVMMEENIDKKLRARDERVEKRIAKVSTARVVIDKSISKGPAPNRREEAFHKCRRSLKIWPVLGDDLADAAKVFMARKLKIGEDRIRSFGNIAVTHPASRASRDRKEVLVMFEDREDRDYVKSMGINLAGEPGAGMSIHVPGHLLDNLHALNEIGYNIKRKNSDRAVKRAVKFDDSTLDLFLDICIGGQWKRIFPKEAKEALRSVPPSGAEGNSRDLTTEDLTSLLQGESLEVLNPVVVPQDESETQ